MLNGYCEMTTKDGKIYFGDCVKDKKEGFGVYYTPKPLKIYVGFWKHNKQEGVGKLITDKGEKYGFWNQGEKLNWYSNYEEAEHNLGTDQYHMKDSLKMEFKDINKYISRISII